MYVCMYVYNYIIIYIYISNHGLPRESPKKEHFYALFSPDCPMHGSLYEDKNIDERRVLVVVCH